MVYLKKNIQIERDNNAFINTTRVWDSFWVFRLTHVCVQKKLIRVIIKTPTHTRKILTKKERCKPSVIRIIKIGQ